MGSSEENSEDTILVLSIVDYYSGTLWWDTAIHGRLD